jgi:hypothetical protein
VKTCIQSEYVLLWMVIDTDLSYSLNTWLLALPWLLWVVIDTDLSYFCIQFEYVVASFTMFAVDGN